MRVYVYIHIYIYIYIHVYIYIYIYIYTHLIVVVDSHHAASDEPQVEGLLERGEERALHREDQTRVDEVALELLRAGVAVCVGAALLLLSASGRHDARHAGRHARYAGRGLGRIRLDVGKDLSHRALTRTVAGLRALPWAKT